MKIVIANYTRIEELIKYKFFKLCYVEAAQNYGVTLYFADAKPVDVFEDEEQISDGSYIEDNPRIITVLRLDILVPGYDLTEAALSTPRQINAGNGYWGSLIFKDAAIDLISGTDLASFIDELREIVNDGARKEVERPSCCPR